jgi:hypothetical protein
MQSDNKLKRQLQPPSKEPSKRARTTSPTTAAEITFRVNPSPDAEKLVTPLHGLPLHRYVNLRAVALFAEVNVSCFFKHR